MINERKRMPHSPQKIRFSLFSRDKAKWVLVFDRLGYVPSDKQKYTLGGLEFYDKALRTLLLPNNIDRLVVAMREEGIDIDYGLDITT